MALGPSVIRLGSPSVCQHRKWHDIVLTQSLNLGSSLRIYAGMVHPTPGTAVRRNANGGEADRAAPVIALCRFRAFRKVPQWAPDHLGHRGNRQQPGHHERHPGTQSYSGLQTGRIAIRRTTAVPQGERNAALRRVRSRSPGSQGNHIANGNGHAEHAECQNRATPASTTASVLRPPDKPTPALDARRSAGSTFLQGVAGGSRQSTQPDRGQRRRDGYHHKADISNAGTGQFQNLRRRQQSEHLSQRLSRRRYLHFR